MKVIRDIQLGLPGEENARIGCKFAVSGECHKENDETKSVIFDSIAVTKDYAKPRCPRSLDSGEDIRFIFTAFANIASQRLDVPVNDIKCDITAKDLKVT